MSKETPEDPTPPKTLEAAPEPPRRYSPPRESHAEATIRVYGLEGTPEADVLRCEPWTLHPGGGD